MKLSCPVYKKDVIYFGPLYPANESVGEILDFHKAFGNLAVLNRDARSYILVARGLSTVCYLTRLSPAVIGKRLANGEYLHL